MAAKPPIKSRTSEDLIKSLLEKKEQVSNQNLQRALTKLEEKRAAEMEEKLLKNLETVQRVTDSAVENLRVQRKKEALSKQYLLDVNAAAEEFYKNADFSAYSRAVDVAEKAMYSAMSKR